ncbi:MAG: hypothetical protein JSS66_03510 [Armatimonadetes bacterium]|nr:hypothetical protein [Armatimonadota bacterium]
MKSSLKLRTQARNGALTLRLGVKKYVLPFEVRMISSNEYIFVHIPPSAEIMKLEKDGLKVVTDMASADEAVKSFRRSRKRSGGRSPRQVEMPAEVAAALSKIPSGYKLAYGADGSPRLVKTRRRRSKK